MQQNINLHEMLGRERYEGGKILHCPVCSTNYTHLGSPGNVRSDAYRGKHDGKQGALFIPMWCEAGHQWTLILDQHKGEVTVGVDNIESKAH